MRGRDKVGFSDCRKKVYMGPRKAWKYFKGINTNSQYNLWDDSERVLVKGAP